LVKAAGAKAVATVAADAHGAAVTGLAAHGAVATEVDAFGVAATGTTRMAETGAVAIGVVATGTTGTAIGIIIIMAMMSSSLVASDFRGRGAIRMDIMEATHMVIVTGLATAMEVTRMVTVMDLGTGMEATNMVTVTAMEMKVTNMAAPAMEMDTATGADPELPSYSAASLALVIITDPSTAS